MNEYELKYYECLSEKFKNKKQVLAEIINLKAIMNLPKGTEHFVSDIHGEYEMFLHILKTASGVIKRKIDEELEKSMTAKERASLACLIYYPEEKLAITEKSDDWFRVMLYRLIRVAKCVSAKYTRSKVRKMLPRNFAYIIDELLNCDSQSINKENYYKEIIENIIRFDLAEDFLKALCSLIQSLAIDHLHIVGDIFDRGPRADIILDYLKGVRSLDIQWGNHDILWIGAGLGDPACILSVLCDCFKYNNLELLEDGYSINLLPVYNLVNKYYKHSDITAFKTKYNSDSLARLLKAVSVMRFKVEDSYKKKYTSFNMQNLTVLDKIDFKNKSWNGYSMKECDFPTIDVNNPDELNQEEGEVLNKLVHSFVTSSKLKSHIKFLLDKGSIYLCYNNN
ncbi:MAG: fructose-1,6-bisphosphatase, partial [Clostridia bacterium]|nr:fructose-1,6-bisphosphatase [Clostridia bacterium]